MKKLTVKESKAIREQLTNGTRFTYPSFGAWDNGKRVGFKVSGYRNRPGEVSAIYRDDVGILGQSMNIDKVTDKVIYLFTFDMACNKTTAKMELNLIEFT